MRGGRSLGAAAAGGARTRRGKRRGREDGRCRGPWLALEQPRVEVIVRRLEQLDDRRGLRDVGDAERAGVRERGVERGVEAMMDRLRLDRADDAAADRGRY